MESDQSVSVEVMSCQINCDCVVASTCPHVHHPNNYMALQNFHFRGYKYMYMYNKNSIQM